MKELLIESKGIRTDYFFIPPFEVRKGDFILFHLDNHISSVDVEKKLIAVLTGKEKNENVRINKSHTFVKHVRVSKFRRIFFPITVGEYLFRNIKRKSKFAKKIYEINWITKKTQLIRLPGNPRKLISLYSVLSKTDNIIFDLAAQDFEGMEHAAKIVKDEIGNNGSAILIDWSDHLKSHSTKYIKIKWSVDLDEYGKKFKF